VQKHISSRATWYFKFAFPAAWIALFALFAFPVIRNIQRGAPPGMTGVLGFIVIWTVGAALLLHFTRPLMRVELRGDRLYASDFRRETEIRPSDIASVTQNIWINVRPITLHLRAPSEFGRHIRFIPPARVIVRFWVEDPIVDELREFARVPPVDQ